MTDIHASASERNDLPFILSSEASRECEHCGEQFKPREKSGGKPQRFCKPECRLAFHSEHPRSQRSPTCSVQIETAATPILKIKINAPEQPEADRFAWGDSSTLLPDQPAVAAYFNPDDDLVIRQERAWDQDEDTVIIVRKQNIDAFINKLTDRCGIPSAGS